MSMEHSTVIALKSGKLSLDYFTYHFGTGCFRKLDKMNQLTPHH